MFRNQFLWLTKCLLFCLLGMFLGGRLSDLIGPLIWWLFHQSGTTSMQRPSFIATYYLPLIGTYGFALGLIPFHRLQKFFASALGHLRFKPRLRSEMIFSRPLLWAWLPVGMVLLFRVLHFQLARGHSVLTTTTYGESAYQHFLAPLSLGSESNLQVWIIDRFLLTGPTLFLLAYTVAVWLRHQLATQPASPVAAAEEAAHPTLD
jgi:hypothetical protein